MNGVNDFAVRVALLNWNDMSSGGYDNLVQVGVAGDDVAALGCVMIG